MKTTIANLGGEQRNNLHHLTKDLKRSLNPLIIICYGHRAMNSWESSAFNNFGPRKKLSSSFDIFLTVRDDEPLQDMVIVTIAQRISFGCAGNIMVFRFAEIKRQIMEKNRFFTLIFKHGIVLAGKEVIEAALPQPLPSVNADRAAEQNEMLTLINIAKQNLKIVGNNLQDEFPDLNGCLGLLNESATCSIRYVAIASCGADVIGGFQELLDFSRNITADICNVFPRNTVDEVLLTDVLSLSIIEKGYRANPDMLHSIYRRTAKLARTCEGFVLRKIWPALPAS